MSTNNFLTNLPVELIIAILRHMIVRDIVRCRQISSLFRRLVDDSPDLQYIIELAVAGMHDGNQTHRTIANRREVLRKYQLGRNTLRPDLMQTIDVPCTSTLQYMICGGAILLIDGDTVDVIVPPSPNREIPQQTWKFKKNPALNSSYLTLDISLDLLIAFEETTLTPYIHILSLHTGDPHPLAPNPRVALEVQPGRSARLDTSLRPFARINGDVIGIHLSDDQTSENFEVRLFQWHTGQFKLVRRGISHFDFLDYHTLVLATQGSNPVLEFFRLHRGGSLEHELYTTVQIPKSTEHARINGILIASSVSTREGNASGPSPFVTAESPYDGIFVIEPILSPPYFWRPKRWRIIIRMETIWSLISKSREGVLCSLEGLDATQIRILEGPFKLPLWESVHGSRYLDVEDDDTLVAYDFGKYAQRGPPIFGDNNASHPRPIYDILYHPYWEPEIANSLSYVKYRTSFSFKGDFHVMDGGGCIMQTHQVDKPGAEDSRKPQVLTLWCI